MRAIVGKMQAISAWGLWIALALGVIPVAPWIARKRADRCYDPCGGVIVALGAEMLSDGTIGVGSYWRGFFASWVWHQSKGKLQKIIVCGGKPHGQTRSLARALAELLVVQGVPKDAFVLDEQSSSTRGNALHAKALLPQGTGQVALVTSDYHMLRARRVFANAGLPVVTVPYPDAGKRWSHWPERLNCYTMVAMELVKIAYYRFQSWI